jgi:hypothetical protein
MTGPEMLCVHAAQGLEAGFLVVTTIVELDQPLLPAIHLCGDCFSTWQQSTLEIRVAFLNSVIPVCNNCFDELASKSGGR